MTASYLARLVLSADVKPYAPLVRARRPINLKSLLLTDLQARFLQDKAVGEFPNMLKTYVITTEFRFVLAATDHLHRKLAKFEARMHSLEDALTIAQTTYNLEPHPLLSDREDIYTDTQELKPIPRASEDEANLNPYIPGSLHVNGSGINRFFGPSGAPEVRVIMTVTVEY